MASRPHNLEAQRQRLLVRFPSSSALISRSALIWRGKLQPTPMSRVYSVKLTYKIGGAPSVHVVHPTLEKPEDKKLPHVYKGDKLCLYRPNRGEWSDRLFIADTIVPWAAEWLFHYEIWLATGTWTGGGEHPGDSGEKGHPLESD